MSSTLSKKQIKLDKVASLFKPLKRKIQESTEQVEESNQRHLQTLQLQKNKSMKKLEDKQYLLSKAVVSVSDSQKEIKEELSQVERELQQLKQDLLLSRKKIDYQEKCMNQLMTLFEEKGKDKAKEPPGFLSSLGTVLSEAVQFIQTTPSSSSSSSVVVTDVDMKEESEQKQKQSVVGGVTYSDYSCLNLLGKKQIILSKVFKNQELNAWVQKSLLERENLKYWRWAFEVNEQHLKNVSVHGIDTDEKVSVHPWYRPHRGHVVFDPQEIQAHQKSLDIKCIPWVDPLNVSIIVKHTPREEVIQAVQELMSLESDKSQTKWMTAAALWLQKEKTFEEKTYEISFKLNKVPGSGTSAFLFQDINVMSGSGTELFDFPSSVQDSRVSFSMADIELKVESKLFESPQKLKEQLKETPEVWKDFSSETNREVILFFLRNKSQLTLVDPQQTIQSFKTFLPYETSVQLFVKAP